MWDGEVLLVRAHATIPRTCWKSWIWWYSSATPAPTERRDRDRITRKFEKRPAKAEGENWLPTEYYTTTMRTPWDTITKLPVLCVDRWKEKTSVNNTVHKIYPFWLIDFETRPGMTHLVTQAAPKLTAIPLPQLPSSGMLSMTLYAQLTHVK